MRITLFSDIAACCWLASPLDAADGKSVAAKIGLKAKRIYQIRFNNLGLKYGGILHGQPY